jgi:hypothetical protein
VEVVQTGNLLFLSGMLPVAGGKPAYLGRLGVELTVEDGRQAAAIACLNVLSATRHHLGSLDKRSIHFMVTRKQPSLSSPRCFFLYCWLHTGFRLKTIKRRIL